MPFSNYSSGSDYRRSPPNRYSPPLHHPTPLNPSSGVDPAYSVEEVFVRHSPANGPEKQDTHLLRAHQYRENINRHRGRSLSSHEPRARIDEVRGRRRFESDSDSGSEDARPPRRRPSRRRSMVRYSSPSRSPPRDNRAVQRYTPHALSHRPGPRPLSRSRSTYSSSDSSDSESASRRDRRAAGKKLRRNELLALTLATVTTAAACNNIYQSHQASKARRAHVRDGELKPAEAKTLENQSAMMDLLAVGVAAVGVNNAVGGWRKYKNFKEERRAQVGE